jgi:hypothetical protein
VLATVCILFFKYEKSDIVKTVQLDRESFKRLIGPLEEILKRNMERYKKYM